MDCKDLMIGDWVKVYAESKYYTNQIGIEQLILADYFEPIPLTEEILKTNDFQLKEGGINRSRYVLHDKGYVIDVYLMKGYVECFNVEHNYFRNEEYVMDRVHKCGSLVHELQHALRLCGLNELADNFKIK